MIIGISVPVLLALIGVGVVVVLPRLGSHAAAAVNPNCTLIVPANPLSAQGLATPYQLVAPDAAANGPCNEANANQGAFVQGTIFDPATGTFSVYSPLVIDQGTQPAVVPTAPNLPANAVVGLWFGFNGTNLTLQGAQGNTLAKARCVNGLNQSVFGQFAYCNAVNFFRSVNQGIAAGKVTIPALGMAKDGMPCMTSRDFGLVDMDQSDNVQTQYLANANGQTAQVTAANQAQLAGATTLGNPSDNALLTKFVDPALGCTPWMAPDLANPGNMALSMALDEIQANALQAAPVALVPLGDPMTLNNNNPSLQKTTLYRRGVNQPAANANNASTTTYCKNLLNVGAPRLQKDMALTMNATSPAPAVGNTLFTFLVSRFNMAFGNGGLNCTGLLNVANPAAVTLDANGVAITGTITLGGAAANGGTGTGTTTTQTATGTATVTLDANAGNAALALNVTYANHPNAPITVSIVDSAAAKTLFSQQINTDNNSQTTLDSAINGLQGLTAIPNTWVFNVADPNMNNTVVGSGTVVANGTTGTATLGTLTPAAAGTNAACTPGATTAPATGNAAATPTVAAATGNAAATPTVAAATGNAAATTPTGAAAAPAATTTTACNTGAVPAATAQPAAPATTGQGTTTKHHHHHHNMW
jgi:hypothetical protein